MNNQSHKNPSMFNILQLGHNMSNLQQESEEADRSKQAAKAGTGNRNRYRNSF